MASSRRSGHVLFLVFVMGWVIQSAGGAAAEGASSTSVLAATGGESISPPAPAAPVPPQLRLPDYLYERFVGTIGGYLHIVVNLTKRRNQVSGDCYEAGKGVPVFFGYSSHIDSSGAIRLDAGDGWSGIDDGGIRGVFDGSFVTLQEIRGTWHSAEGGAGAEFRLVESGATEARSFTLFHSERGYYNGSRGSATADLTFPLLVTDAAAPASASKAAAAFNRNEKSHVLGLYTPGAGRPEPSSVDGLTHDFLRLYLRQTGSPEWRLRPLPYPPWIYQIWSSVIVNRGNLVSVERVAFWFEGGAHPDTIFQEESYDLSANAPITLPEILKPGTATALNAIGLEYFRREHAIPDSESLAEAGYFVSDSDFRLNSNFMIVPSGLVFRFNQYEIGPYVMGAPEVFIPFAALKSILRPESPIASLVSGG